MLIHGEGLCFLSGYLSVPVTGFLSLHTRWPDQNVSYESLRPGCSARGKKGWNLGSCCNDFNHSKKFQKALSGEFWQHIDRPSHLPALPGAAMVTKLPDPLRALGPGQQEFDRLCGTGRVSLGERLGSGL